MLAYTWMLCGALAFTCMGAFAHALREEYDWQLIAFARALIPFVLMGLLARTAKVKLFFRWPLILWIRSLAGSISLVSTFFALTKLPISDVLTLTNLFPV